MKNQEYILVYPFIRFKFCPICGGGEHKDQFSFYWNLATRRAICVRHKCGYDDTIKNFKYKYKFKFGVNEFKRLLREYFDVRKAYDPELIQRYVGIDLDKEMIILKYKDSRKYFDPFAKTYFWANYNKSSHGFMDDYLPDVNDKVVVTFGEFDALSLRVRGITAVSAPNGDGSLQFLEHLKSYNIYLCPDNDGNYSKLASAASKFKNIYVIDKKFYRNYKDINDLIVADEFNEKEFWESFKTAKDIVPFSCEVASNVVTHKIRKEDFGLRSYFYGLDACTLGFHPGQLILIAGSGGSGKTTFTLNLIAKFLKQSETLKCLYWSGEQSTHELKQILSRILAGRKNITVEVDDAGFEFFDTNVELQELSRVYLSSNAYQELNLNTLNLLEESIQKLGIKVLVIDNLMTVCLSGKVDDYYKEQAMVIQSLKQIASRNDCVVIVLTHTRKNTGKTLIGADIEGSAKVRNYADVVLLLDRDIEETTLRLDKNRNTYTGGRITTLRLEFDPVSLRFVSLDDLERSGLLIEDYDIFTYPNKQNGKGDQKNDRNADRDDETSNGVNNNNVDSVVVDNEIDVTNREDLVSAFSDVDGKNICENVDTSTIQAITQRYGWDYYSIDSPEQLEILLKNYPPKNNIVSIDTETTSLNYDREIKTISLAWRSGDKKIALAWHNPVRHFVLEKLLNYKLVGANIKFDLVGLSKQFNLDFSRCSVYDVLILAQLLLPIKEYERYNLDQLSKELLNITKIKLNDFTQITSEGLDFDNIDRNKLTIYACEDAHTTYDCFLQLILKYKQLTDTRLKLLIQTEMRMILIALRAELTGLYVDRNKLEDFKFKLEQNIEENLKKLREFESIKEIEEELKELEQKKYKRKIVEKVEFNPTSIKHRNLLLTKLSEKYNLKLKITDKGNISYDKLNRIDADIPELKLMNEILSARGFLNSNVQRLLEAIHTDGAIRTMFSTCGTISGRMSSTHTNVQNIPSYGIYDLREAIVPRPGKKFLICDFSQIELRILALLARSRSLIEAFERNEDIHQYMANILFGHEASPEERKKAKTITFGILYGMGVKSLSHRLGISEEEGNKLFNIYKQKFSDIFKLKKFISTFLTKNGYVISMYGRRRYFDKNNLSIVQHNEAFNHIIQATAADIFKGCVVALADYLLEAGIDATIVNFVHDEVVIECLEEHVDLCQEALKAYMYAKLYYQYYDVWGKIVKNNAYSMTFVSEIKIADYWKK